MTPIFRIIANSVDATSSISDRFVAIRITDNAGFKNDRLSLTVDDRKPFVTFPSKGDKLEVSMGWGSGGQSEKQGTLRKMGTYIVDEIEYEMLPYNIIISGHASDTLGTFTEPRDESYHDTTIGELVVHIAARNGYTPVVSEELAAVSLEHRDQVSTSDSSFLQRLATEHDAVLKVVEEKLVFAERARVMSVSGAQITVVQLNCENDDLTAFRYLDQSKSRYVSVVAKYYDQLTAEEVEVEVRDPSGQGVKVYRMRDMYTNAEDAEDAARGKLSALNTSGNSLSFTVIGNPELRAESRVELVNQRTGIPNTWEVLSVEHHMNRSGYITNCECETKDT